MSAKVFISYKSEYRDFARRVQQRLRAWGYRTWFDMDDIPKGAYFRHAIQEGLDTSDVLVGVMTQEAFQSREVMAEWDYFLSQNKDVVPLKYRECRPLYHLVTIQWIDFTADERRGFAQLRATLRRIAGEPERAALDEEHPDLTAAEPDEQLTLQPAPALAYAPQPVPAPPDLTLAGGPWPAEPERDTGHIPSLPLPPAPRKSAARLLRPLAALAAMLIVGVVGALLTNAQSVLLPPNLTQAATPSSLWALLIAALAAAAGVGYWYIVRRRAAAGMLDALDPQTQRINRQRMLSKVEALWLRGAPEAAPAALSHATLRHRDYGDYPLPASVSIASVFDDMQRELLILGAPGAGKTILLLQLARELLSRARADDSQPIPVLFDLSSWTAEREPLDTWLADELRVKYQAPRRVAEDWLMAKAPNARLTLLLDGLDAMDAAARREACVAAINRFRQALPQVDIAICGRSADYEMLTSRLDLRGALVLQPPGEG